VGIWRRIPLIGKLVIGVGVPLFGLWTGYLTTIRPRIRIQPPSKLVDPRNPYNAPFALVNDGYLSVYQVTVNCIPAMVAAYPTQQKNPFRLSWLSNYPVLKLDELPTTDNKPFVCDIFRVFGGFNTHVAGAEVQISVQVSPFRHVHWPFSKSILFEATSEGSGKFHWHELAIGEQPHFPKAAIQIKLQ
jgi:hypothetical protein